MPEEKNNPSYPARLQASIKKGLYSGIMSIPVIVEGHIHSPALADRALELGAFAVVVGAAITQPEWITSYFVKGLTN